jgi:hypothetical protein
MASDDFSIKTKITLDTKNYEAGIKKAESATQKFSSSLSGVTKLLKSTFAIAGISVGTKAIVNFGKEAVKSAESANKTLNILNNTLKVTGASAWTTSEDLVKMSEEIAYSTNYTVGEIQDMQSVLLGFKNITGDTFREASDAITDMATVMGMDLKSAVQTVGKALDDPIKGLDSLRRQGFAFTDEQKEELKQLVENGEQLKAQKIILDELNTTYGGAAKAAQSSFDKQRDAVDEFKETLGNQLIPVLDVFAEKSATSFSKLTEKIKTIDFSEIAGTVEYSVQVITEYFGIFYNNAKELVRGLTERFGDVEISLDTVKEAVYNSLNNIYKQMQISFGFVKALIDGDWKLAWEYAKIYVLNVCKKILDGLDGLLQKMPELVNGTIKGLNAYYEAQDKVLIEWLHLPEKYFKAPRIGTYDGKNFIDTTELQKQIDEATSIIEEATGKQVTINLTGLEKIEENKKKYQKNAEAGEIQLTKTVTVEEKKRVKESETIFSSFLDNLRKQIADKTEFYNGLFSKVTETFSTMFSMLGENLAGAGHGFEDFANVALKALSEVLKSISAQLSAIAVLKALTHNYAEATAALAGATAAMVASGVFSAVTSKINNMKTAIIETSDETIRLSEAFEEVRASYEKVMSAFTKTTSTFMSTHTGLTQSIAAASQQAAEAIVEISNLTTQLNALQAEYDNYLQMELYYVGGPGASGPYSAEDQWRMLELLNLINELQSQLDSWSDFFQQNIQLSVEQTMKLNLLIKEINDNLKNQIASLDDITNSYNYFYALIKSGLSTVEQYNVIYYEQLLNVKKLVADTYTSLTQSGQEIGSVLISSIIDGATKEDFLRQMKDYIRQNLLKLTIYTESFQNRLAEVGTKIATALTTGGSIADLRTELETLWNEASTQAQAVESVIADVFGDLDEVVEETTENITYSLEVVEEKLSTFETAMVGFYETISDLGGDIANELVSGLTEGLSQSDFMDNMKKWIRKMLVQSVVYTKSMKAEIEAIGAAITKGLSEGFTETTFHEIRRDLSWVFEQANQTINGIDNILNSVFGSGYATGTDNATSGLHLVGEAGPELVRFSGGEKVYNANETRNMLSSGNAGNTFNVTFKNTKDTTAFAMIQQLKQYNRQMAINGVM